MQLLIKSYTLRSNVFQFRSYEFGCDPHQIYTQQPLPYHEAENVGKEIKRDINGVRHMK